MGGIAVACGTCREHWSPELLAAIPFRPVSISSRRSSEPASTIFLTHEEWIQPCPQLCVSVYAARAREASILVDNEDENLALQRQMPEVIQLVLIIQSDSQTPAKP